MCTSALSVKLLITLERIASNSLLGRHSGTRQMHLTDLNERLLPWTQDKFEKVYPESCCYYF